MRRYWSDQLSSVACTDGFAEEHQDPRLAEEQDQTPPGHATGSVGHRRRKPI